MAEKKFRVDSVYGLLCDGASRANIIQFCSENWDVGERTADNYIAGAREQIEQDCLLSRQQFLAETLAGLARSDNQQVAEANIRLSLTQSDCKLNSLASPVNQHDH